MRDSERSWASDWRAFVEAVGRDFGDGLDNESVTARYAGQPVTWFGTVTAKRFDDADDPGIQMEMPPVMIRLADGRNAAIDYLFLHLNPGEVDLWRYVDVGDTVRFRTRIGRGHGPFAGVRWSDVGDNQGIIMFATEGAVPVDCGGGSAGHG